MNSQAIHIYLVEDSKVDLVVNTKLLKLMDDTLIINDFPNGESFCSDIGEFVKAAASDRHIVLLDIQLPSMSGFNCLSQLREQDGSLLEDLEIYLLSSSIDRNDIQRANEDPDVLHVLEKPLDIQVFKRLISHN